MKKLITFMLMVFIVQSAFSQSLETFQRRLDSVKEMKSKWKELEKIHEKEYFRLQDLYYTTLKEAGILKEKAYNLEKSKGNPIQIVDLRRRAVELENKADSIKERCLHEREVYEKYTGLMSKELYEMSRISDTIRMLQRDKSLADLSAKYGMETAKKLYEGDVWVGMTYQMMVDGEYRGEIYYISEDYCLGAIYFIYEPYAYFKMVDEVVVAVSSYYLRPPR